MRKARFSVDDAAAMAMVAAMHPRLAQARLYGILDLGYVARDRVMDVVEDLCAGGVDLLQLRAKGHAPKEIENIARVIQPMAKHHGVPIIINDHPDVAKAIGADGVHVGQDDGSLEEVRAIVGETMWVGRSTHSAAQAYAALEEGFDCIGFGPLFPTPTKRGRPGIGLEEVAFVEKTVGLKIPVFCIGGITFATLPQVIAAGARRVVIVSALLQSPDIRAAVREAKSLL
jgi:thiamine-phosphate pyrophosphorylase